MDNFDYKGYLKNNPLLTESLHENSRTDVEQEGYEDGFKDAKTDIKTSLSKMKVSELKSKIKEDILSMLSEDEEEEDINLDVDVDFEDTDVDINDEDGLSPEEKVIQNSLQAALNSSNSIGNQKLSDQIGNTITFFTREYIVGRK